MKRLLQPVIAALVVLMLAVPASRTMAGCPSCGGSSVYGYFTSPYGQQPGWGGYGLGWWGWGGFEGRALIFPPPNRANYYPDGGFTFYDGEMCSCLQAHSNYSRVDWITPPAVSARMVLEKLHELNIPLVSPEPQFLGRNPRIADGVKLPVPRSKKDKDKDAGDM
jgi:hypothetical protein